MAVLVEAISVVVRTDAIHTRYPGGWPAFGDAVPNETLACDEEIARVGFMVPDDVKGFVNRLQARGLVFLRDGHAQDIAVADQQRGLTTRCDWLEFGHVTIEDNRIAACRMIGSQSKQVFTPDKWCFEGSLSQTFGFIPEGNLNKSMTPVSRDDSMDIYTNRLTGKFAYVGRVKTEEADANGSP